MARTIYDAGSLDLMPSSIAEDEVMGAIAKAVDEQLRKISDLIQNASVLPRLAELPDEVLDLLAWELSVDFWDASLPREKKLMLIAMSLNWHGLKGTRYAVEYALNVLPYEVELVTQEDAQQRYQDAGGQYIDGTWELDGSKELVAWEEIELPRLDHWAQFCVIANESPEGWRAIKNAVNLAKRCSSWPLWIYDTSSETHDETKLFGRNVIERKDERNVWNTPMLDGSWLLDDSVELGEQDIDITGELE